jgi:hypothetical protein
VNDTGRLIEARRARYIAAELEAWRDDRGTPEREREAILAVTTGSPKEEDQYGTEEIYQVGFLWYSGKLIVRNGQDHGYQPPMRLQNLLHDWCQMNYSKRSFGLPAQEGFIIKRCVSLSCDGAYLIVEDLGGAEEIESADWLNGQSTIG